MSPGAASLFTPASCSCNGSIHCPYLIFSASSRHRQILHKQLSRTIPQPKTFTSLPRSPLFRRFSVKSMQVSGPGSIDSALIASMHAKLKEQLKAEEVIVKDANGDGRHVSIDVVSSEFEGKSSVNRQRMVYKAIWEEMQTTVHAVDSMRTRTPAEAAQEKQP